MVAVIDYDRWWWDILNGKDSPRANYMKEVLKADVEMAREFADAQWEMAKDTANRRTFSFMMLNPNLSWEFLIEQSLKMWPDGSHARQLYEAVIRQATLDDIMKLKPILKSEPTKPSDKKGWVAGIMISFEWEKSIEFLKRLFKRKSK